MALDLEEQEQVEELKAWWKQHGMYVIAGISAFVIGVVGWKAWEFWSHKQASEASVLFGRAMQATMGNNSKSVKDLAGQIMDNHGRSAYAAPAAWLAGKTSYAAGDLKSAQAQYQYALEHAKDAGLEQLARLRLASIMLDQKNYAEAMKQLDGGHDPAFAPLFANLKGDVLAAQGKTAEANAAYKLALGKLDAKSPLKALVEMKLDSVGG